MSEEKKYCVYVHTTPIGKKYIGCSNNVKHRWANGKSYKHNRLFYLDILVYGWDNIKHDIVADCLTKLEAEKLETLLIENLKTFYTKYGYNMSISNYKIMSDVRNYLGDFECIGSEILHRNDKFYRENKEAIEAIISRLEQSYIDKK